MEAAVEYSAFVTVQLDLELGQVVSVGIRAPRDEDDTKAEVSVGLDSEIDQPDELFDRAQQVDAAAPFNVSGWWAPAATQRWTPAVDRPTTPIPTNRIPGCRRSTRRHPDLLVLSS